MSNGPNERFTAIEQVWYNIAGMFAMVACTHAGRALAQSQIGIGFNGGTESIGHALTSAL